MAERTEQMAVSVESELTGEKDSAKGIGQVQGLANCKAPSPHNACKVAIEAHARRQGNGRIGSHAHDEREDARRQGCGKEGPIDRDASAIGLACIQNDAIAGVWGGVGGWSGEI
jgi:hypothetical protein